jgi:hypothetical protein
MIDWLETLLPTAGSGQEKAVRLVWVDDAIDGRFRMLRCSGGQKQQTHKLMDQRRHGQGK